MNPRVPKCNQCILTRQIYRKEMKSGTMTWNDVAKAKEGLGPLEAGRHRRETTVGPLIREQPNRHLDFRLLASRTER